MRVRVRVRMMTVCKCESVMKDFERLHPKNEGKNSLIKSLSKSDLLDSPGSIPRTGHE